MKQYIAIDGMHCNGCVSRVKKSLEEMDGIEDVEVILHPGQAILESEVAFTDAQIEDQLKAVGDYQVNILKGPREEVPTMIELNVVKDHSPGVYYCPMLCEGEKTYDHFRDCPVCGMDLVKDELASSMKEGKEEDGAYQSLLKKFFISLLFTVPIFIISMGEMVGLPIDAIASPKTMGWVQFFLALPVVFYACWNFFLRGYRSLINKSPNMWTLILLGAGSAFLYSVFALLFPEVLPDSFKDPGGNVHLYFEATVVILTLVLLGQVIEARAHSRTGSAIRALLQLVPPQSLVVRDGKELTIDLEEIRVGDVIIIKPGDKIPVDGYLIEGEGIIDESMISGEPMPIEKTIHDQVIGGTINNNGSFRMRAEKVGSETMLAQIIQMVSNASKSRAPIQRLADKISFYFVPVVVSIALIAFVVWGIWGPEPSWVYALTAAISVLIIACPCALGLATPMSIMVGTGRGAKDGILFKQASVLEQLAEIDTLVIDKTGTLTEGKPEFNSIVTDTWEGDDLLRLSASLENLSEHPISNAIVGEAHQRNLKLHKCEQFKVIVGKGLKGKIEGREIIIGNLTLMQDHQLTVQQSLNDEAAKRQSKGEIVVFVAIEKKVEGIISISDPIKSYASEAIKSLKQRGVEIIMMTGDVEATARSVAGELNIESIHSRMLPQDKYNAVKAIQEKGKRVAMAGDGINDAPALAMADIGIAMGTGTDIAIESADMTIVKGDIGGIVKAINLSSAVMKNIKQNLFFAFIYNMVGVPIAAGILFPFIGVLLSPMLAALAMSLSSVSVITNSLRLQKLKL
ncbi:MAG: copper-translocating P-type ATPase [Saprospiraceae bacterium]|nr:copper-translocating P-type ATPase [Saprospiraceae bacterium]